MAVSMNIAAPTPPGRLRFRGVCTAILIEKTAQPIRSCRLPCLLPPTTIFIENTTQPQSSRAKPRDLSFMGRHVTLRIPPLNERSLDKLEITVELEMTVERDMGFP
jgi:hypothetical protein